MGQPKRSAAGVYVKFGQWTGEPLNGKPHKPARDGRLLQALGPKEPVEIVFDEHLLEGAVVDHERGTVLLQSGTKLISFYPENGVERIGRFLDKRFPRYVHTVPPRNG